MENVTEEAKLDVAEGIGIKPEDLIAIDPKERPPASLKLAAEGKIIFEIEFDDRMYDDKRDFKVFKLFEELYNLEGGKEIFEKYEAKLDVE